MSEEEIDRKITVIFATDVVGYSKHMEADESGTRTKIISSKIEASGNRGKNYRKVSNNLKTDKDPNVLRCNMFPRK